METNRPGSKYPEVEYPAGTTTIELSDTYLLCMERPFMIKNAIRDRADSRVYLIGDRSTDDRRLGCGVYLEGLRNPSHPLQKTRHIRSLANFNTHAQSQMEAALGNSSI
ncbi:hypothetical protein SUGI_1373590 [Cryptomeria japonica]|uniref:Uncharacterized protein n=1 Tax=Cryptomeria japonica TaxID=3369 RepID=A0AAD3NLM4_CRYJA|nr:hypothetical protein SUGI_1373590 [Cryptomeria japonica]